MLEYNFMLPAFKVEMQCQNDFTSSYSVEEMRNNAEISMEKSPHFPRYLRSKLTKSLVGLVPRCDVTHDTEDNFSESSILLFSSSLHKNVFLWEQSDFEMEFDILLHGYQPFDCVLQFGSVRCDVTSENPRQMYESTPFCLVNNKVLDLGKYCAFDRKLIGYVSFIYSICNMNENRFALACLL